MKTAWVCFWVALGAVEVGLAFWSHSATFAEMGAMAPAMIAYNLLHDADGPGGGLHLPIEARQPTPAIG